MRRWVLPACAMALRMKCTRQRCQVALNILVMAAFSPSWGIRHDELDAAQAASGQAAQRAGGWQPVRRVPALRQGPRRSVS